MMSLVCGRYVAATAPVVLAEYFEVKKVRTEPEGPSWNVAPTDDVPAVTERAGARRLETLRWGLVPSWAKDTRSAARLINARAESVATAPSFRAAFARRRCLLAADGFFEWERRPGRPGERGPGEPGPGERRPGERGQRRRPWYIQRADGAPLAMAGLWEVWRSDDGELLRTCTVVTTAANQLVARLHNRMPVLLPHQAWAVWLDPDNHDTPELAKLLVPADERLLVCHPVSTAVNNVRNNGPELIEPATEAR